MKVISPKQMTYMESKAYKNGASEDDFMEEAGSGVALVALDYAEKHDLDRLAILLCGKGNNAGDAYVAGIHLIHLEYEVFALQIAPIAECSPLCKKNYERFLAEGGRLVETLTEFPKNGIIIDGIFGTGFRGTALDTYATIIQLANESGLPIIAVDIPSGLNGETGHVEGAAIIAVETAFLGLPKTGFFLNQGWDCVGKLRYVDFGLNRQYIEEADSELVMLTEELVKPFLPPIKRSRHKYEAGYVVGLAGSSGMPGAAILSSTAALRGGAGIVRLLHPDGMQGELAASPYELIRESFHYENTNVVLDLINKASAVFIGPGMGRSEQAVELLRAVLPNIAKPSVIDADALTLLAQENIDLPKNATLTPHHGEMARLLNMPSKPVIDREFLKICQDYCEKKEITLVLKGGPTFILHPGEAIMVNPIGDPGMATAGSGDVLTGLIAALLAQGIIPKHAAPLAVFLHGIAGEHAALEMTSRGIIASDLIFHFPEAFKFIML